MIVWIVGIVIAAVFIFVVLDREVFRYEGVHLGPRVQGWLYDKWSAKYDQEKQESQINDAHTLTRPLLEALASRQANTPEALILDVATGTGRFPLTLLSEPAFLGRVIALDVSRDMLARAAEKLAPHRDRVVLIRHTAVPLPFPKAMFDVVGCMEALEIMPEMEAPLAELSRVLRPGGVLVTTRGTEAWGLAGKIRSAEDYEALLRQSGFVDMEILPWWKDFDLVWARKPGQFPAVTTRRLVDILRCPSCYQTTLTSASGDLQCINCGRKIPLTPEGILLC